MGSPATQTAPTGTVTFFDSGASLGQGTLDAQGHATFSTSALAIGAHPITASYAGDANFLASASSAFQQTITPFIGDFSLTITPAALGLYTGESGSVTVSSSAQGGFNYDLALSCSGLPPGGSCQYTSQTIKGGSGKNTILIATTPPQAARLTRPAGGLGSAGVAGLFACLLFIFVPRGWRKKFVFVAVFAWLNLLAIGCSDPINLVSGTPPGTYTITVTASTTNQGQQMAHTANLTLAVKSLF